MVQEGPEGFCTEAAFCLFYIGLHLYMVLTVVAISMVLTRLQVPHILLGGGLRRVRDGTRTLRVHRGALRGYGRADREDLLLRQ